MDMPMKKRRTIAAQAAARGPLPKLPSALLDELVKGPMSPSQVQDLMLAFNKALIEWAMNAEMNLHLGHPPGQGKPAEQANERNGVSGKTILTEHGSVRVGLPEAVAAVFPKTTVQTCIVHLIRTSLDYAGWKDRKPIARALRPIYAAANEQQAAQALQDFAESVWGQKYPTIVAAWQRAWDYVVPLFAFAPDIRRVIYTTNAIESLNMQLRKIIKTRGHFPTDEAVIKLLWLALRNVLNKSVRATFDWKAAMNQFAILFEERFTQARG